jgi:hypothetical protein
MINSNRKGKNGEREFRDKLREHGFAASRGQQHRGGPDSPDVVCSELSMLHFEVKIGARINLRSAYCQSTRECAGRIPVVAHRTTARGYDQEDGRKTEPWMITLSADDFLKLIKL